MKIVMTLMVRDEADIVGAMLAHHRAQGVDHVVVTDNGSVDGTADILRSFAAAGFATVWHDPVHRKQQFRTVTKMARFAAVELGADWVVNADADEFFVAREHGATIRDALALVPTRTPYLTVPVVNLTGSPAKDGSGLGRLRLRDERSQEQLNRAGIPFPPTADTVHRGHPDVEVAQGNHFVSAPGWGQGEESATIEVLHLPWRSWRQYEHKVQTSGAAYLSNPELTPSPRHHGMQDYRRWQDGRLEQVYVAKHPTPAETTELMTSGALVVDDRLAGLQDAGFPGSREDQCYSAAELQGLGETGRLLGALEATADARFLQMREQYLDAERRHEATVKELEETRADRDRLAQKLRETLDRRAVRVADRLASIARGTAGGPKP